MKMMAGSGDRTVRAKKSMKGWLMPGQTAVSDRLDPFNIPVISIPLRIASKAWTPDTVCLRKIRPGSTMAMMPPGLTHCVAFHKKGRSGLLSGLR